ncbi:coniferyl aldehyde dehydrogenase [Bradyrhizobium diazoefficiens]|nr:coniferyl aldehyde dehydrogenase [Bradyrhizobium diazoefficiens]UCF53161.1 MAG: coniferyl aldehyde dehydrogenase [Bradyrhizobium sp.]MBR0979078.1 coniferyl aldehyde dehydrogenase [Bradyrhizobium diazoefficiens]MBR1010137.1 coniferyl aldehyde dehydrogenase [Bradyrhizobium diazoefficiens]MBR1017365.1 coniferyl aldehyde dehydrogenase [Bradyrhizobium diazoefficiens]
MPGSNAVPNVLDRSPRSVLMGALEDGFQAMVTRSRTEPAPDLSGRLDRLARLRAVVADNEERFRQAISADFGHRCAVETTIAEAMMVYGEIRHATKHLKSWMAPQRIATALQFLPARNRLIPQPLGVVGIIAPWNYPLQLTLAPAIGAIAAGNRVIIKPSELAPRFAGLLRETVAARFDATELLVTGVEDEIAKAFASLPFDHLVFTGSTRVGRLVAEAAGRNLTPVTLELGGKSPAIIDASADLDEAAERIAYGKLLNAGQTCIAPDYVLVPEASLQAFAEKVRAQMRRMFGTDPANKDYTAIISDRHYARLEGLVADAAQRGARILQPAQARDPNWKAHRKFPPTLIVGATADMAVMQEEIFGPVLPVLGTRSPAEAIAFVNARDRPLALYWFGKDDAARDEVLARTVSGGATVNDCLFHFAQANQPMGGVGASGTGAYHGEWGFRTFSKLKPVFYRSTFNRLADLYPPYGGKIARLEKLMRFMS